ncbi:hypothetical protein DL95DRAFT_427343 [Leptodontidium sp. 2 PMI_412]|nr:hypothetical protein DL95DRAFT_427343 [Leptodontidium sp. 2 PMI_412]
MVVSLAARSNILTRHKTIIVTGSNVGLGLEAARHLVRLDAVKVILAVCTLSKGEQAKGAIEASVSRKGVVEVWPLDLESYDSVKAFASRAEGLPCLDIVNENPGEELTVTVNVVFTLLLAFLFLPKLRETATKHNQEAVLTFTSSLVHYLTEFPERAKKVIFEALRDKETARMDDRFISSSAKPKVIINNVNPGFVATKVGSRTLVHAAEGGVGTHGSYLIDCKPGQYVRYLIMPMTQ